MMYRKTALVHAEQFLPAEGKIPAGVVSDEMRDPRTSPAQWAINTLEGLHYLRDGDYICTGPGGERWNVERAIFEATYEEAHPQEAASVPGEGEGGFVQWGWRVRFKADEKRDAGPWSWQDKPLDSRTQAWAEHQPVFVSATHPAREDGPAGQWQDIVRCGLSDIVDAASSFCDDGDLLAGEVRVRVKRLSESLAAFAAPTKEPA